MKPKKARRRATAHAATAMADLMRHRGGSALHTRVRRVINNLKGAFFPSLAFRHNIVTTPAQTLGGAPNLLRLAMKFDCKSYVCKLPLHPRLLQLNE